MKHATIYYLMRRYQPAIISFYSVECIEFACESIWNACCIIPVSCLRIWRHMGIHWALIWGMKSRLCYWSRINSFKDINFSVVWPRFFICKPGRWPNTTSWKSQRLDFSQLNAKSLCINLSSTGHIFHVQKKESTVESPFAFQSDALSKTAIGTRWRL